MDAAATPELAQLREHVAELEQSLARRTREMVALHEISLEINRQPNLAALLQAIVEKAAGLLNARLGGLYLMLPDGETLELVVCHNLPQSLIGTRLKLGEGVSGRVAQTGQLLIVPDYRLWEGRARVYEGTPFRRVVGVPLKRGDKIIGVINISDDHRSGFFDDDEIRLASLFADQAAIAVDKVRLWDVAQHDIAERQRAAQIQSSLYRISEAAHTALSLDELYRLLHAIVAQLMPARNFGIALYDPSTDLFSFPYRVDEHYPGEIMPPPRRAGKTLIDYVWKTGTPLLATADQLQQLIDTAQLRPVGVLAVDWLGVPLKWQGTSIGVMVVQTYTPGERLTEEHKQILTFVSTQVATAIQRKRAEQRQASIYRISEAALAARSLNELYGLIHEIVNEWMPAKNLYIALYDEATDLINFPYLVDERDNPTPLQRPGKGLTAYVLRTGRPLLATPDVFEELWRRGEVELIGGRSIDWLGVPLTIQQKTIGVLAVQTYSNDVRLTDEHKDLLVFVSAQVAMAIQRKRAEEALQESEEKYRILFSNDLVPICLFDAITLEILDANDAFLKQYGYQRSELLAGLSVRDVSAEPDSSAAAVQQAVVVGSMFIPLRYHRKKDGTVFPVQLVSGPFLWKGRTVFFSWIQDITDRLQAETALRDSEQRYHDLFDAAQRQAQELALIDRVRTTLTRELDLDALFRTVVTAITDTFGYTLVSLYILEGADLVLQHQIGYDYVLDRISIASGVTGRVVQTRQAVLLEEVRTDPAFLMAQDGIISEVCVPLTDQGRVVGVLNVESAQGVRLTEADLRLMQVLAEHVSIAISQARLYTEARENAARLRTAVENLPFDFWALDKEGRYVLQNATSVRHWGDRLGRRPSELQIDPAIAAFWEQKDRRAFAGEIVEIDVEYNLGGEERFFHEISGPIRDGDQIQGILGVNIDITDRHRAEEALRDSEERYRLLFENNPHPMWAYDVETLAFLAVNDAAIQHYGYAREEFLRMTITDIRPPEDVPALLTSIARRDESVNFSGVWRHRKKDGTLIEVEITTHTLILDGQPARIVLVNDVTEHRRAEEALRRAQKMESLGVLAGGIAHDFNNLLVAMLGQTSLALGQLPTGSPARQPIEKAVSAARRAADLTRQLLAYSGRGQFERRPIQLNHLIQENLHLFEVVVPKNVVLRSELTDPLPSILGDAGQIQQVVMNLIINAAEAIGERRGQPSRRFADTGGQPSRRFADTGGQVVVRTRPFLLTPDKAAWWQLDEEDLAPSTYVLLEVEDNGCGMTQETVSRIFDPFFSTKFTGRGLGLAAVLGIVRGHDGGLRVESELNVGTTFELVFPGADIAASETLAPEVAQEADMLQHLILVIDDEEPVRGAVTDILELEGLTVLSAPDGQTGLDLYRVRQADIDLIMLDLSMPGLTGEETFRVLRQINSQVRIMLSSGYSHDEVASRFAGQREVAFIQKPYDATQLVTEVKRQLALPPS